MRKWFILLGLFLLSCQSKPEYLPVIDRALNDENFSYYVDFRFYPKDRNALPIGVFDSGTGGLTVLEALLSSRLLDSEDYIYLGDQANMPYGNYPSEDKTDFLRELVVKDALFLLEKKVKIIVVACNTATAYGLGDIRTLLEESRSGIKAIGVIDAGVTAALNQLDKNENAAIGVLATVGTIASGGYENALMNAAKEQGYRGTLRVISQVSMGFAEAVDGDPDFIDPEATAPRSLYRGPSQDHPEFRIDTDLLDAYRFDFSENHMLYEGSARIPEHLQLNAPQNYARYHLLSLVEKLRRSDTPPELRCLILGCTHYPYQTHTIAAMLKELRDYKKDGEYVYRHLIAEDVVIIDPAIETAREVYTTLLKDKQLSTRLAPSRAAFYISVPVEDSLTAGRLDYPGRFSYEYKYGRNPGELVSDVEIVPFSRKNTDEETRARIGSLPRVGRLLSF